MVAASWPATGWPAPEAALTAEGRPGFDCLRPLLVSVSVQALDDLRELRDGHNVRRRNLTEPSLDGGAVPWAYAHANRDKRRCVGFCLDAQGNVCGFVGALVHRSPQFRFAHARHRTVDVLAQSDVGYRWEVVRWSWEQPTQGV